MDTALCVCMCARACVRACCLFSGSAFCTVVANYNGLVHRLFALEAMFVMRSVRAVQVFTFGFKSGSTVQELEIFLKYYEVWKCK